MGIPPTLLIISIYKMWLVMYFYVDLNTSNYVIVIRTFCLLQWMWFSVSFSKPILSISQFNWINTHLNVKKKQQKYSDRIIFSNKNANNIVLVSFGFIASNNVNMWGLKTVLTLTRRFNYFIVYFDISKIKFYW